MVKVHIPKETVAGETRVALSPESVKALAKLGLTFTVEAGAGTASGFPDSEYEAEGAAIAGPNGADMVLRVRPPEPGSQEIAAIPEGAMLITGMQPALCADEVRELNSRKVTTLALDAVPRISRAQRMDILSSQATVAGYKAVLLGAHHLPRFFPMLMTAAGTIRPAKVLVMGAGVAGLMAIATAKRLGANVEATDVRAAVKEQVESLGAKFLDTTGGADAEDAGGYAKEQTAEDLAKQQEILAQHVAESDVVITTAQIPGRKAPVLVTEDMVARMKPGAVVVDLAVSTGGNCPLSQENEVVEVDGVKIVGEPNLPALLPGDASRMFGRNVVELVKLLFTKEGEFSPDWEDEVLIGCCVTRGGEILHPGAREALGMTEAAS